ncbi:MAG: DUF6496 domain-containing protein [Rhodanobacter sp.]
MPESRTRRAAARDKKEGKSPATQAGEYVHEEIEHVRKGKHGARSTKQAIAIGLSKARRAGVKAKPGKSASKSTRKKAAQDEAASHDHHKPAAKRSRATTKALKKEGHKAVSKSALSAQAKKSASKRTAASRSAAAKKAAHTKGAEGRSAAAKKAAKTRARKAS